MASLRLTQMGLIQFGLTRTRLTSLIALAAASTALPVRAAPPSLADSFRLGSGGGVLCQVQVRAKDAAVSGIFDRAWAIVCRDAAQPVGSLYALRGADAESRLAQLRVAKADCVTDGGGSVEIEGVGATALRQCRLKTDAVGYQVFTARKGRVLYVAEGLEGYSSALTLGLQTVIADKIVPGKVTVATAGVTDPAAFARVQAGTLDPDQALAEGYRRNNSGDYAEAAEFFDTLQARMSGERNGKDKLGEYLVNRALQKSNLGAFDEADALFAEAAREPQSDRVQTRLQRNFRALHQLNQQNYDAAVAELDKPVVSIETAALTLPGSAIEIGNQVAAEINSGLPAAERLGGTESTALTPDERAEILDAQALQIRGTLLRLKGDPSGAQGLLDRAMVKAVAVRDGRVLSITRLRAQILAEGGLALEDAGNIAGGEAKMRESLTLLATRYPQTSAMNGARARLAAYLARHGQAAAAMAEFKQVVQSAAETRTTVTGLGNLLAPYFRLLTEQMTANPALADEFFLATQTLVRPGVADTQAILARELSEGSSEGSRLFRQARTLDRDIERARIEIANLIALPQQSGEAKAAIAARTADLGEYQAQQTATQALLAAYPQYRALTPSALTLGELRTALKPGEAYFKLLAVGRDVYGLYVGAGAARAWKVPLTPDGLDAAVSSLRDTIVIDEGGQLNTYPFDMAGSHALFTALLGPVQGDLAGLTHLIFEPDGAMLKLPLNLLVTDQASVDRYAARTTTPDSDQFDFRNTAWLGRKTAISTSVAARAFRDARSSRPSLGTAQYLGLGQNAPVSNAVWRSSTRGSSGTAAISCSWPAAEWDKPVSAAELRAAGSMVGAGQSAIVTGADFTDTGVMGRSDLANYRILHFATHGLVTAPRPECPARPALLTSFGGSGSDGLLSFREIYDLKIDADLVILSACDTAGKASVAATREAGVSTGGGNALDGLVRAFIGAGGRSVLASHWPAPDDYNATQRLIGGLFAERGAASVGDALRDAQVKLMDDPQTSHPYYWAGFAIVGDGSQALLSAR